MKTEIKIIIILILIISGFLYFRSMLAINNNDNLVIKEGILDLTQSFLNEEKTYHLTGDWDRKLNTNLTEVNKNNNEKYSFITYSFNMVDNNPGQYHILIPDFAPYYRVFVNNELKAEMGNITDGSSILNEYGYRLINIDRNDYIKDGDLYTVDIVINSSFYKNKKSDINKLLIGKSEGINSYVTKVTGFTIFITGSYFTILLFAFSLYIATKKEKYFIYLGLIAVIGIINVITGSNGFLCPGFCRGIYDIVKKADIVTSLLNIILLFILFKKVYKNIISEKLYKVINWLVMTLVILLFFNSYKNIVIISNQVYIFTFVIVNMAIIFISFKAFLNNLRGSVLLLSGLTIYIISAVFQYLIKNNIISNRFVSKYIDPGQYGFLICIFTFVIVLSIKYGNKNKELERIVQELEIKNNKLVGKDYDRAREIKERNLRLQIAYTRVRDDAEYDPMTDVLRREAGLKKLEAEFYRTQKNGGSLSICFVDINDLKEVNDNYGHHVGDDLILTVVKIMKGNIRNTDYIIRMGGDEFLICFPNTNFYTAEKVWYRILNTIKRINNNRNTQYDISMSHGIEEYEAGVHNSLKDIIRTADQKMYKEKEEMKNN